MQQLKLATLAARQSINDSYDDTSLYDEFNDILELSSMKSLRRLGMQATNLCGEYRARPGNCILGWLCPWPWAVSCDNTADDRTLDNVIAHERRSTCPKSSARHVLDMSFVQTTANFSSNDIMGLINCSLQQIGVDPINAEDSEFSCVATPYKPTGRSGRNNINDGWDLLQRVCNAATALHRIVSSWFRPL
jgi:hypothetical protein